MTPDDVMQVLRRRSSELVEEFGATSLSVFGSVARGSASTVSDVDILVDFPAPPTFDQYIGLKFRLEDLLGSRVDLVTRRALRPRARPFIEAEAVRVT